MDIPNWTEIVNFIEEQMKTNQWFQTVGFFGLIGFLGTSGRKGILQLWSRIERKINYVVTIEETDPFFFQFRKWVDKNHNVTYRNVQVRIDYKDEKSYKNNEPKIVESTERDYSVNSSMFLNYSHFTDLFYIIRNFRIIRIWKGREKLENANNLNSAFFESYKISSLWGKKSINKMLEEVLDYNKVLEKQNLRFVTEVFINDGTYWSKVLEQSPKDLENIILPNKEEIVSDLESFLFSKDWYKKRSLTFKRGYIFQGSPGNGKTALTMSISKKFKRNLYIFNPQKVKDSELISLYSKLPPNSILNIEDIDAVFNKNREANTFQTQFNFSTLLNLLDGALSKDGIITIFTTNHPERLDPALIREGRIDKVLEVGNPSVESIQEYLKVFYEEDIKCLGELVNNHMSMVEVQNVCLRNKSNSLKSIKEISEKLIRDNVNSLAG